MLRKCSFASQYVYPRDVSVSFTARLVSQWIHISKYHTAHQKYIQLLFVNFTSMKPEKKMYILEELSFKGEEYILLIGEI